MEPYYIKVIYIKNGVRKLMVVSTYKIQHFMGWCRDRGYSFSCTLMD